MDSPTFKRGDVVAYHRDDDAFPLLTGAIGIVEGAVGIGEPRYRVAWLADPTGQLTIANRYHVGFDAGVLRLLEEMTCAFKKGT